MPAVLQAEDRRAAARDLMKRGADLLSQQLWCWGRDILREQGNWLIETGFDRLAAPADREDCSSVYSLELPEGRRVVLRGFGIFYGDDRLGGVVLKRFEFRPRYTTASTLECPPWTGADLPKTAAPDASQRDACLSLATGLVDWIASYEANVAERLGTDYRQATIDSWKQAKGPIVPASEQLAAWHALSGEIADHADTLFSPS